MRTSADIDVLIKSEDFDKATELLFQNDFTTENERTSYDRGFYFEKTHLELHHSLCRNSEIINDILKDVWDNAAQKDGYEYAMEKEFFAFHHITHMLSHILDGGCGIRPFIDLWIMRNKRYYDEEKLKPLLKKCGLVRYYEKICELSEVWMEGKPHNEVTESLQKYILKGGTYGSEENGHEIGVAANNQSRFKYIWKLAFPDYKFMCYVYPSVKKHRILLPLCYVHRIFSKLFGKERKRIRGRIKNINSSNEQNVEEVASLIKDLGLN